MWNWCEKIWTEFEVWGFILPLYPLEWRSDILGTESLFRRVISRSAKSCAAGGVLQFPYEVFSQIWKETRFGQVTDNCAGSAISWSDWTPTSTLSVVSRYFTSVWHGRLRAHAASARLRYLNELNSWTHPRLQKLLNQAYNLVSGFIRCDFTFLTQLQSISDQ